MSNLHANHLPPLWSWQELSAGLTGRRVAGPDVYRVTIDSRQAQPGDLFLALPGDPGNRFNPSHRSTVDGHDFVEAAAKKGAVGALVHKKVDTTNSKMALLKVKDTYDGLWTLGRMARSRLDGQIVAITGSNGKTTAKQFLTAALDAYAPPGSFNNHIGVPLALANAPENSTTGVFEVGTNHPGEIEPLAKMIKPDVAMVLNVHQAHIENFTSRSELKEEKISIFNSLKCKDNSISEDTLGLEFGATFGETRQANARVKALEGDCVYLSLYGRMLTACVPGGGIHRAKTVAATVLACHILDRDLTPACQLSNDLIPAGRGNIRRVNQVTVIDDSYNANPQSMRAGLSSLLTAPANVRVAVIGEMLELGSQGDQAHLELAPLLESVDHVICVGAGTHGLAKHLEQPWFPKASEDLTSYLIDLCKDETTVFIKGSNRIFWANQFVDTFLSTLDSMSSK